jgi:hypothetical protein
VTQRSGVMTSATGEVAPRRGKGGDNASWANANLSRPKMRKIHAVDSVATIGR